MIYKVMVVSNNSWNVDGSAIIERECEHNHRTLSGACRCMENLQKMSDGNRSAKWFNAEIRHADESPLTEEENSKIMNIEYEKQRI